MKKEYLEALKSIKIRCHSKSMRYDPIDFDLETIEQALINYTNITKQIEEADYKSAIGLLVKVKDNLNSYTYNTILEALLKAQEQENELEEYKKLNLPLLKQILENGIWLKGGHNNFYHLSPTDMNIVIKEDYFIIQELYFEDLDCVMDTTGFELCSSDYKENFWLKEDRSE